MPVGSFYSQVSGGGGSGAPPRRDQSLTGSGPASQPSYTMGPATPNQQFPSGSGPLQPGATSVFPGAPRVGGELYNTWLNNPLLWAPGGGPLAGAQSLANTIYGPQQQILADQLARQYEQMGLIGVNADYQAGMLNRDNALARQALGIDRQALGIDRNLIAKQLGLNDRQLANVLKQLGIDEASLRDNSDRKQFDLRSDLTARGSFGTVANERGTGRIARDLMYGLGGIGTQREGARISHEGTAAGLNARLANIGLDTQRLGISEQQLANSLQDGLYNIGLGSQVSINNLLDAIGGTNMQQSQVAATILGEVAAYANLPPEVLAQLRAALGGAGGATPTSAPTPQRPTRGVL